MQCPPVTSRHPQPAHLRPDEVILLGRHCAEAGTFHITRKLVSMLSLGSGFGFRALITPHADPVKERIEAFAKWPPRWICKPLAHIVAGVFVWCLPFILTLGFASFFGFSAWDLFPEQD
jgi:hypothetical protein